MPRRAGYGIDREYEMLRLALMEQDKQDPNSRSFAPGRVPSSIAMNAYLGSLSPTAEQAREADVLGEMDRRFVQNQEEDRKRASAVKDRHNDATIRNFETRTGRGTFTPVGTEPNPEPALPRVAFTPENFRPMASHASTQPEPSPLRQITRGPSSSGRNSNTAFTDPDMAMSARERARLDPRVMAAEAQLTGDLAIAGSKAKDGSPSPYAVERVDRNIRSVDELIDRVNLWTSGPGAMLSAIPGTDARDFNAELDTLKANIAFGELTAMREASKTGGALGNVSNIELGLLESALGALDTRQSPANLRRQLAKVRESQQRWKDAVRRHGGVADAGAGGAEFDFVPGRGLVPRGGAR